MSRFIDVVSIFSVLGIWPRYIEPKLVKVTSLDWSLPSGQEHLDGLKIAHFSDLHFHAGSDDAFLDRVARRILRAKPDLILFTGDFICYSRLEDSERLKSFLERLQAPLGSYCTFGNHDYESYVSRDAEGRYAVRQPANALIGVARGLTRLMKKGGYSNSVTDEAASTPLHAKLSSLIRETPFTLLENMTVNLPIGLNITGLGELALGRFRPKTAFASFDKRHLGLVLSHNPDTFLSLADYPGDWIFSGHTHGEQIHLPFCRSLSRKLASLAHPRYTRGQFDEKGKRLYVTRGIGSYKPFRLFSPPEVVIVRARKSG